MGGLVGSREDCRKRGGSLCGWASEPQRKNFFLSQTSFLPALLGSGAPPPGLRVGIPPGHASPRGADPATCKWFSFFVSVSVSFSSSPFPFSSSTSSTSFSSLKSTVRSSLVAQRVKDSVLSLQWLVSLLWCGFNPWPGNFCMQRVWQEKKILSNLQSAYRVQTALGSATTEPRRGPDMN